MATVKYWDGAQWVATSIGGEVYEQPDEPASTTKGALWLDTDDAPPTWTVMPTIPRVTSLPAGPTDGQMCCLSPDSSKNVLWLMRYNSTGLKWEALSGPPIFYTKSMAGSGAAATLNAALAGLSVTVPALPVATHARIAAKFRLTHNAAAGWQYSGCLIRCTPTAVASGSTALWDNLRWTYGTGGPTWIDFNPHNYFDLAAATAYTIDVVFHGGAQIGIWDSEPSFIEAEVSPR